MTVKQLRSGVDKLSVVVSAVGPLVQEFMAAGVLVFFGPNAPDELREFAILHTGGVLNGEVEVGDQLYIDHRAFQILAVGEVANQNIRNLGHFVVKFNSRDTPEMPGDICAEARPLPPIHPGSTVVIRAASA